MYDKVCSNCNYKLSYFYRTGMLGCPKCYEAFEKEILNSIKDIQGGSRHKGKGPSMGVDKELLAEYKRLLAEKELAVMEGRFSDVKEISLSLFELSEELKKKGLI